MLNSHIYKTPVVILAAGEAKRLQPLSNIVIKPITPIAGMPIICRIIQNYIENGFHNFVFVLGPEEKKIQEIIDKYVVTIEDGININYVTQDSAKGMGDAILKVEKALRESYKDHNYFILTASDVLYEKDTPSQLIEEHINQNANFTLALFESEDENMAEGHGNVLLSENGHIAKIIEKPGKQNKISNLYSMPTYVFSNVLFDFLKKIEVSSRGELELQSAIQLMIEENLVGIGFDLLPQYKGRFPYEELGAYHLTYPKDLLKMTFRFLEQGTLQFEGEYPATIEPVASEGPIISGDSLLIGPNVYFGKGCKLDNLVEISNSVLMGNNVIGKATIIIDSIIGPNVIIQDHQKVMNALILENIEPENL